jgi:hypothetical protein
MMLPVFWKHMRAFALFANSAGLRYAQCNPGWVMTYDVRSRELAIAWLIGRGLGRQIVPC